jgi:hypothetical protein
VHPLHTELPSEFFENLKIDPNRATGRSTIRALEFIARALKNPNQRVYVQDHHYGDHADRHLLEMIKRYVYNLQFKYFSFGKSITGFWVCFGDLPKGANGKLN